MRHLSGSWADARALVPPGCPEEAGRRSTHDLAAIDGVPTIMKRYAVSSPASAGEPSLEAEGRGHRTPLASPGSSPAIRRGPRARAAWALTPLFLTALIGCDPEPGAGGSEVVVSASELSAGQMKPGAGGMVSAGGDVAPGSLEPGIPEEPKPGVPDEPPPPDGAPAGGAAAGAPPGPPPPSGPQVLLKGVVTYKDYSGGVIQIDVMDGPNAGPTGKHPKVVQLERLEKPGPFEIKVSATAGAVYLAAFNDADENGRPDREDPRGEYGGNPVTVEGQDVEGIELILKVEEIPPPPSGF